MAHRFAQYWNRGEVLVPVMTGAATLMDGADILEHAQALGIRLPFGSLLDVGCGTGRVAQFATAYLGTDIAADAVAYCQARGIRALVVDEPERLPTTNDGQPFDWITCLSVFTHIDAVERRRYLEAFAGRAPGLLVDIIPGDGAGDVALWTAVPAAFEQQLEEHGWGIVAQYERLCPSGPTHRYYACMQRSRCAGGSDAP